jgi:hypothetical protein
MTARSSPRQPTPAVQRSVRKDPSAMDVLVIVVIVIVAAVAVAALLNLLGSRRRRNR